MKTTINIDIHKYINIDTNLFFSSKIHLHVVLTDLELISCSILFSKMFLYKWSLSIAVLDRFLEHYNYDSQETCGVIHF